MKLKFMRGKNERSAPAAAARLRVLHVIPGSSEGSEMIFARREVQGLQHAGIDCEVFFLRSRLSPLSLWSDAMRLRATIREWHPDLLHAQFGTMTAFFTAFVSHLPVVITYRGTDLNPDPSQTRVRSFLGRTLSRVAALRAAAVVCVTRQLRERLWWNRERATVLPGSVDLNRFTPAPRSAARAALGWEQDEHVVLFNAGRFPKVKRPDLAARAAAVVRARLGRVRLHVLDGSTDPEQVPTIMSAADCLLITSDWEGSPTILREALACNLPVVSVEVGDVSERLEGVAPAAIVRRDPEALGAALAEILRSRNRSNGREKVRDLSVDAFNEQLAAVYRRALSHRGKSRADAPQADSCQQRAGA